MRLHLSRGQKVGVDVRAEGTFSRDVRNRLLSIDGMTFDPKRQAFKLPLDVECLEELGETLRTIDGASASVQDELLAWIEAAKAKRDELVTISESDDWPMDYELADRLFDFQRAGAAFMARAERAMNNDEMGLGKTVQAIAAIREWELRKRDGQPGRYLFIVPNNATGSWRRHAFEWHPPTADGSCAPPEIIGSGKVLESGNVPPGFYIINWEKVSLRLKKLLGVSWDAIVADESHRMKNRNAQRTKAVMKLTAPCKFILTGTPIRNDVSDLWTQFAFLQPERFTSFWAFVGRYMELEEVSHGRGTHMELGGTKNVEKLQRVMRSIRIGRTDKVDLPKRVDRQVVLDLGPRQQKVYRQMLEEFVAWVSDQEEEIVASNWMTQALRLKQITGSLGIFSEEHRDSVKIDWLMDRLEELPDEKFVAMSQFETMVREIGDRLRDAGISYAEMTGQNWRIWDPSEGEFVKVRDKDGVPKRWRLMGTFQRGIGGVELPDDLAHLEPRVFLSTTPSGGESVTLTGARYFVFMDLMWVPGDNEQARKRVHRISQDRPTFIYELFAEGTVDVLTVLPTLKTKQDIIDAVLGR